MGLADAVPGYDTEAPDQGALERELRNEHGIRPPAENSDYFEEMTDAVEQELDQFSTDQRNEAIHAGLMGGSAGLYAPLVDEYGVDAIQKIVEHAPEIQEAAYSLDDAFGVATTAGLLAAAKYGTESVARLGKRELSGERDRYQELLEDLESRR